jgi:LysM repeat protein
MKDMIEIYFNHISKIPFLCRTHIKTWRKLSAMTYKVKSGDTMAKIAKANGINLEQLLDANPRFKANPNRIRVGDVLNIPDGQSAPVKQPSTEPQPQPQPSAGRVLGKLSEKYEVGNRGPGTVSTGKGDAGGASYGSYQMTSKPNGGTVKRYVSQPDFIFRDRFTGLTPGSADFSAAWKDIAANSREEFQNSQHDFIKKTHFDPLVQKIINEDGLNVLTRSHTLQDVIWSTAVQHGPGNDVIHKALATLSMGSDDPDFDRSLIVAIYGERGRKAPSGNLARFSRNSPEVQKGVAKRFRDEQKDALKMLDEEMAS